MAHIPALNFSATGAYVSGFHDFGHLHFHEGILRKACTFQALEPRGVREVLERLRSWRVPSIWLSALCGLAGRFDLPWAQLVQHCVHQ